MTIPNTPPPPRVWTGDELAEQAQIALEEFVDRRLAEPGGKYVAHIETRRAALFRLFKEMAGVDPANPPPETVRKIISDEELFSALRYVAGPPISEDDLGVIVTRSIDGFNRKALNDDDRLPVAVLKLICQLADPYRFPWIASSRAPSKAEIRNAISTTGVLQASQSLQTERRGYGRLVEKRLETRLTELGFLKISGRTKKTAEAVASSTSPVYPEAGKITQPSHHPTFPHFYGECTVYGRKVDLFIALKTGRMVALEAKDSSSGLNSTKRLLNDTAAKAKHYTDEAGKNIISVALLSGVFKVADLVKAQKSGLYLVWAHNLDEFIEWIKTQA